MLSGARGFSTKAPGGRPALPKHRWSSYGKAKGQREAPHQDKPRPEGPESELDGRGTSPEEIGLCSYKKGNARSRLALLRIAARKRRSKLDTGRVSRVE